MYQTNESTEWHDTNYVDAFQFARSGVSDKQIAKLFGVNIEVFVGWVENFPALANALERGRSKEAAMNSKDYLDFVECTLDGDLKKVLQEIRKSENAPNEAAKMLTMMEDNGRRMRQQMFLHSYVAKQFCIDAACKESGIAHSTVYWWMSNDEDFLTLVREKIPAPAKEIKQDFVEGGLMKLVAEGNPAAIIFASKTLNKDRGYGDSLDVNMGGSIEHRHVIPIDRLGLEFETKTLILEATRRYQEENPDDKSEWVDSTLKQLNGGE